MGQRGKVSYKPIPAKDILKEIKNLSELMVNLSYCSIFLGDKDLLKEIHYIENRIDELKSILIMQSALATRDRWDAERLVSILDYLIGVDKLSDAAGDIALLAEMGLFIDIGLEDLFLSTSTTLVYSLKIDEKSILANRSIGEIYDTIGEIFDVIAIRRDKEYYLSPKKNMVIKPGDVLFITGLAENIRTLLSKIGKERRGRAIKKIEEGIIDLLVNIKDISEFMVDLAYSILFTHSKELAEELKSIEETLDRFTYEFKLMVMESDDLKNEEKLSLVSIADACERIGDAAMDLTYSIREGLEPHPIIEEAIEESDERLALIKVTNKMKGKTIDELELDKMGIEILAMKKGGNWLIVPPTTGMSLKEGDILLLRYFSEAEEYLSKIASEEEREEVRRDIQRIEWREE